VKYFLSGIHTPDECSIRPFFAFIPVPVPLSTFGAISWHRASFPAYPLVTEGDLLQYPKDNIAQFSQTYIDGD